MGFVPKAELHCKVISFPSDISPSFQHLGLEGFSGEEGNADEIAEIIGSQEKKQCFD